MKKFPLLCLLICALMPAWRMAAYVLNRNTQGRPLRWELINPPSSIKTNSVNRATQAIRYYVAADAYSSSNQIAEINAVRASFAQWQAVPGLQLRFEDAGLAPAGMDINTGDGTNVVYWAKTSLWVNGQHDYIGGALGVCFYIVQDDSLIAEADIVLNGVEKQWTADFSATNSTAFFIESIAAHEIGHWLGMAHSPAGAATMLYQGTAGDSAQSGLSSDEVAAVRALYATNGASARLGHLQGTVRKNGLPVLGAAVYLEDAAGNLTAATVTGTNGNYEFGFVNPGSYRVRTAPLDPPINYWLVAPRNISEAYANADLFFPPSTNEPVTLVAGLTNSLAFNVTSAVPPFRITLIRSPTANPNTYLVGSLPIALFPGQTNITLGVFSADLPESGLELRVSGGDIVHGVATSHRSNSPPFNLPGISVAVTVPTNAIPGMRSLMVTRTNDGARAWAGGFAEVRPTVPDFNFDGLDDRFQRRYFPLFTAPEAAPSADPDRDLMDNAAESVAGTSPTNAASVLKLQSLTQDAAGTTLYWRSVAGKKYQVLARPRVEGGAWQKLGGAVTATNALANYFDAGATNAVKFYRVQALP